jgi:hypothetical protein
MEHISKVYSGDSEVAQGSHELLGDSVFFCNNNAKVGDVCVITEAYSSLTGPEEHSTIMIWTTEKDQWT